jgi:hypothetical protein
MKYLLSIWVALLLTGHIHAQNMNDGWTLSIHKKLLFTGNEELADAARSITIAPGQKEFAKGAFKIAYTKIKPDDGWKRSIMIYNEKDLLIAQKDFDGDTGTWSIDVTTFKKYCRQQKKIFVYTTAIPKDPQMAAMVRVRRILLCTLHLK